MCGRYEFKIGDGKKARQIKERADKLGLVYKQGEIYPGDEVLCILPKQSGIDLKVMRWGIRSKSLLINARVESLDERITFQKIKDRRCAIVCNGFYEWDKARNKYYIHFDDEIVYLACLYDENEDLVILTRPADERLTAIHTRMPIVMDQKQMLNYVHNDGYEPCYDGLCFERTDGAISLL